MSDALLWRSVTAEDVPQIELLALRCDAADGGLEATMVNLAHGLRRDDAIGDLSRVAVRNGVVAAAGWLRSVPTASPRRTLIYAFAEPTAPELRDELIVWLSDRGAAHAHPGGVVRIERVLARATADLPERVIALYESLGFERMYVEHEIACEVDRAADAAAPTGVRVVGWTRARHAKIRAAYNEAFRDRAFGGYTAEQWSRAFAPDDVDARRSFVAVDGNGVVGFLFGALLDDRQEWVDPAIRGCGWIDTVGVVPEYRGRGIGAALVVASMHALGDAGIGRVLLRVNADNDRARRVYERLGFEAVRKHVVYVRRA